MFGLETLRCFYLYRLSKKSRLYNAFFFSEITILWGTCYHDPAIDLLPTPPTQKLSYIVIAFHFPPWFSLSGQFLQTPIKV